MRYGRRRRTRDRPQIQACAAIANSLNHASDAIGVTSRTTYCSSPANVRTPMQSPVFTPGSSSAAACAKERGASRSSPPSNAAFCNGTARQPCPTHLTPPHGRSSPLRPRTRDRVRPCCSGLCTSSTRYPEIAVPGLSSVASAGVLSIVSVARVLRKNRVGKPASSPRPVSK